MLNHPTLLEAAYEMALALFNAEIIDLNELKEFEELCLKNQIKKLD